MKKHMILISALSLIASAGWAGSTHLVCNHEGFSKLSLDLKVTGPDMALLVTSTGNPSEYNPKKGETAALKLDQDASKGGWYIFSSVKSSSGRGFTTNMNKTDYLKKSFKVSVGMSKDYSDYTYASYEMTCTRE